MSAVKNFFRDCFCDRPGGMFTRQELVKLIIPLILEQLLACTIGIADTVMVSTAGDAAVSGVSLVDSINALLIQVFAALASGGAVITSQYLGRGDKKNATSSAMQLLWSSLLIAILIGGLSIAFNRWILRLIFGQVEDAVMKNSVIYFYLTAASYPFLAVFNSCAALFRSMNNSRVSLFTSVIMNLVNIAGNAILIYGLKIGVAGAGTATLLSRIVGSVIMIILLCRGTHELDMSRIYRLEPNFRILKQVLRIGIPNGLEGGMFQVGKLLVQRLVSSFGTAAIAANAITGTMANFACVPGNAVSLAMVTVIGRCVGAGEYGQARHYTRRLLAFVHEMMLVICIALALLTGPIITLFRVSADAGSQAYEILMLYYLFSVLIWPESFTLPNSLRAAGDARFTMCVSIFSMWTTRIGASYLFCRVFHLGLLGVWLAMFLDWIVRAFCFIVRFARGHWTKIKSI